jgi:methionine-rich copper-binding protein CopC
VQTPVVVAPSALALSSSTPADGATGVSVSANLTLTFNNALPAGEIYHVTLTKADGTVVAGAFSLDATQKILTINPTANLDASSVYLVGIGVTDIYGQHLQTAINFTTA